MQTPTNKNTDNLDVRILNILRCEPPSIVAFNLFEYGGLTRSVFRLLQSIDNLEEIVSNRSEGGGIHIPSSSDHSSGEHMLSYQKENGTSIILANTHNVFSGRSDVKYFARTGINGNGKKYNASFVALEVYRKEDAHPVCELGFYVTEKNSKDILYGEELIVDIPYAEERPKLYGQITSFALSMGKLKHNKALKGIAHTSQKSKYLKKIIADIKNSRVVTGTEFNKNRTKWFRYLSGTSDVKNILKFEDRYGYKEGYRVYRVELLSSHLVSKTEGKYFIRVFADTEGDTKFLNPRNLQEGPYAHRDALIRFLEIGNTYLDLLHLNAEKGRKQFEISLDLTHIDYRYATIVKDKEGRPIIISSWETPYGLDGKLLPHSQPHHYLQLWGDSSQPLRLDEEINFEKGSHPRKFMGKLLKAIPDIEYGNGSAFIEQAANHSVPFKKQ